MFHVKHCVEKGLKSACIPWFQAPMIVFAKLFLFKKGKAILHSRKLLLMISCDIVVFFSSHFLFFFF